MAPRAVRRVVWVLPSRATFSTSMARKATERRPTRVPCASLTTEIHPVQPLRNQLVGDDTNRSSYNPVLLFKFLGV
eukprot:scaffold19563_cov66-Phaeocystis_antarctica.AAC.1